MSQSVRWMLFCLLVCLMSGSCGGPQGPPRKETFPLRGQVFVDGQPAAGVIVSCVDAKGADTSSPPSSAVTKDDGSFEISTYQKSDGLPEGEYVLTFKWQKFNAISMSYVGPDQLKDRYSDPSKSTFRVKVEKGKPTPPQKIELSTK